MILSIFALFFLIVLFLLLQGLFGGAIAFIVEEICVFLEVGMRRGFQQRVVLGVIVVLHLQDV